MARRRGRRKLRGRLCRLVGRRMLRLLERESRVCPRGDDAKTMFRQQGQITTPSTVGRRPEPHSLISVSPFSGSSGISTLGLLARVNRSAKLGARSIGSVFSAASSTAGASEERGRSASGLNRIAPLNATGSAVSEPPLPGSTSSTSPPVGVDVSACRDMSGTSDGARCRSVPAAEVEGRDVGSGCGEVADLGEERWSESTSPFSDALSEVRSQGIGLRSGTTCGDERGLPCKEGEAEGRRVAIGDAEEEGAGGWIMPWPTSPRVVSRVVAEVEATGALSSSSSGNMDCSEVTLRMRFTARRYFGREL